MLYHFCSIHQHSTCDISLLTINSLSPLTEWISARYELLNFIAWIHCNQWTVVLTNCLRSWAQNMSTYKCVSKMHIPPCVNKMHMPPYGTPNSWLCVMLRATVSPSCDIAPKISKDLPGILAMLRAKFHTDQWNPGRENHDRTKKQRNSKLTIPSIHRMEG